MTQNSEIVKDAQELAVKAQELAEEVSAPASPPPPVPVLDFATKMKRERYAATLAQSPLPKV
jgi:hypothetical protein